MTKMANSFMGYIALLRQLASFCKGWVGDHCRNRSICSMAYMYSRGWGEPTPPIYIYIVYTIYTLLDLATPKQNFWLRHCSYTSVSSITFPGITFLDLLRLPCQLYLVIIEQQLTWLTFHTTC